jgi:hypothetical protein
MDIFSLNVNDIHRRAEQQFEAKVAPYKKVLERVFMRIKHRAENHYSDVVYEVPPLIIGMPPIDIKLCGQFLVLNLRERGFDANFYDPNIVHVSWLKPQPKIENHVIKSKYDIIPYRSGPIRPLGDEPNRIKYESIKNGQAPNNFPRLKNHSNVDFGVKVSNDKKTIQMKFLNNYIPTRKPKQIENKK